MQKIRQESGRPELKKGETTRQRVLERAAPLFNQRGFAGCSMQDVMDATGLEKGGLYRHFRSKQELAEEVFRYSYLRAVEARLKRLTPETHAVDQLRSMVQAFVEQPSIVAGGCPIMNTAIEADDTNSALRLLALAGLTDWKDKIVAIISQGISRGEIRKHVAPLALANVIVAGLEGSLMISRLEGSRHALIDIQAATEILLADVSSSRNGSAR